MTRFKILRAELMQYVRQETRPVVAETVGDQRDGIDYAIIKRQRMLEESPVAIVASTSPINPPPQGIAVLEQANPLSLVKRGQGPCGPKT